MTDRNELRRLAEAALNPSGATCPWPDVDNFTDAASPEVVLGLLDERDKLRAMAVRLKGYLENIRVNTRQDVIRWDCEAALSDTEVEKL